ncbi:MULTISPECIES: hypothetical protein [Vibrio]|uniref:hypothetical protein n=1 Tax=Vibrio TaxID=662 RepID=UPI0020445DA7|nr:MULTISPECIES: hypothetical protein [unclassified Vibrio]MCM5511662.1 hypothetical protein [Vibrio sp. SCSIO 43169]MDE3896029.1 hypothetical protein [Vibrio sp. CC007]
MKKLIGLAVILSMILSHIANAASGVGTGKVETLLWFEGKTGVLVVQENMVDHGGCGRSDYYILDEKHDYFKEIYSLILSAHIASQPLYLNLEGCVQGISRIKHVRSTKS